MVSKDKADPGFPLNFIGRDAWSNPWIKEAGPLYRGPGRVHEQVQSRKPKAEEEGGGGEGGSE